jgi:hypothetical protein
MADSRRVAPAPRGSRGRAPPSQSSILRPFRGATLLSALRCSGRRLRVETGMRRRSRLMAAAIVSVAWLKPHVARLVFRDEVERVREQGFPYGVHPPPDVWRLVPAAVVVSGRHLAPVQPRLVFARVIAARPSRRGGGRGSAGRSGHNRPHGQCQTSRTPVASRRRRAIGNPPSCALIGPESCGRDRSLTVWEAR